MSFRQHLKEEMNLHDIKTKELSALTQISESTISSYLKTDSALPNVETAYKISEALGISLNRLVSGKEFEKDSQNFSYSESYSRHSNTIKALESLPIDTQKTIETMICSLVNNNSKY